MSMYLDISRLKRDGKKVSKLLKVSGDSTITTEEISIIFPARFKSIGMYEQGTSISALACYYCIMDKNNNYGVTTSPIIQTLVPSFINTKVISNNSTTENDKYIELVFEKGSTVIPNNNLIQNTDIFFSVLQEFFINGNIPFYYNYEDISNVLLETKKYTGNGVGNNPLGIELLTTLICKAPNGRTPYKDFVKNRNDIFKTFPSYVGIGNVLNYSNTGSKLIGNYFEAGITSAIVEPEEKSSDTSVLLRK